MHLRPTASNTDGCPPPALFASLQICVFPLRAFFFLDFCLLFLLSLPSIFRFRFGRRFVPSCLFLVGIMLSPRLLLRLVQRIIHQVCTKYMLYIYVSGMYVRTLISLFSPFFCLRSEVYALFQLLCVRGYQGIIFCFYYFPPEVVFHPRVIGACPVTADCIVAMSKCENNNSNNLLPSLMILSTTYIYCLLKKQLNDFALIQDNKVPSRNRLWVVIPLLSA